jgi:Tfp pilus assembly protein PilO
VVTVIAILAGLLGIALGYAARQREQLMETRESVKKQTELDKMQHTLSQRNERIDFLVVENVRLREKNSAHERNLEMLLREVGKA